MSLRVLFALVFILALASPSMASQTWVVAEDGSGDFTSIDAAHAAASAGDVILVMPGHYDAFHLSKAIAVLGPAIGPKPAVEGASEVLGAPVTLAGLALERLTMHGVAGRALIDDCTIASGSAATALLVDQCADVVVTRCTISSAASNTFFPAPLTLFDHASATIAQSVLKGGSGASQMDGQDGLLAFSSQIFLAGTSVSGGSGGNGGLCTTCGGYAGDALDLTATTLIARGNASHLLVQGSTSSTVAAYGIRAASSTIVVSGVEVSSAISNGPVVQPFPAESFLAIGGLDFEGASRRLLLFGPTGAPALVLLSLGPAQLAVPGFEPALELDPAQIFTGIQMTALGNGQAAVAELTVPPLAGLAGVTVWFQGVLPTQHGALNPSAIQLTNVADVALRF